MHPEEAEGGEGMGCEEGTMHILVHAAAALSRRVSIANCTIADGDKNSKGLAGCSCSCMQPAGQLLQTQGICGGRLGGPSIKSKPSSRSSDCPYILGYQSGVVWCGHALNPGHAAGVPSAGTL